MLTRVHAHTPTVQLVPKLLTSVELANSEPHVPRENRTLRKQQRARAHGQVQRQEQLSARDRSARLASSRASYSAYTRTLWRLGDRNHMTAER